MSQSLAEQVNLEVESIEKELKKANEKWRLAIKSTNDARSDYQDKEVLENQAYDEKRALELRLKEMKNYLK